MLMSRQPTKKKSKTNLVGEVGVGEWESFGIVKVGHLIRRKRLRRLRKDEVDVDLTAAACQDPWSKKFQTRWRE
jgi:hypothetical protein